MLLTLEQIEDATRFVHATLPPTPQIRWPLLCERTGANVWVKHENHQPIGAFKVRGGLVYLNDLLQRGTDIDGVVTATRGNHGQSVAFAAAKFGIPSQVVVPYKNSVAKNRAMRAWGADLIEHGDDFNDALDYAQLIADERGSHFVPSFHPLLVCGAASYWHELFTALPELDTVYVPIGLGSGICAGIAVRDALRLTTRLIGVVSSSAPAYSLSFAARTLVESPSRTEIADGVAVRKPNAEALDIILNGVERIVEVSDEEVTAAIRAYFLDTHNVAEGAGAASLAALVKEREAMRGKNVGLILSGGNVDHEVFARVLSGSQDFGDR